MRADPSDGGSLRNGREKRYVAPLASLGKYFIRDLFCASRRNGNERRRMFTSDELYGSSSPGVHAFEQR